jgi:YVTN family beta-propeller protein
VGNAGSASVSVIDLDGLAVVGEVPAEFGAGAVAVDLRRQRAYCVNFLAASVTVIDTQALEAVGRIEVGTGPCAVVVDPHGDEVYVVNSIAATIARIDIATSAVTGTFTTGPAPVGLAGDAAGGRLYVANRGGGSVSVIDVHTDELFRIPVGTAPGGVCVHPDHDQRILVANAGSGTLTLAEAGLAPVGGVTRAVHPLVGSALPEFTLPELRTGKLHSSREWSERKYILNFFASW